MTATFDDWLTAQLADRADRGLLRSIEPYGGVRGRALQVRDGDRVSFSSNDYLGLAGDAALVRALHDGLVQGAGSGASRLITGTFPIHRAAETALARFVRLDDALLFSSGYAANVGVIAAIVGRPDLVISDRLNHASHVDGCRLSRATVRVYDHLDVEAVGRLLTAERSSHRNCLVVTDAAFSMDGDLAPLRALRAVCDQHDAWLMVDEAHTLGVLGPEGRGLAAALGVEPDVLVGTLGKSFGLAGAFVAGSSSLIRYLENSARSFVFSTAPPPYLANATLRATEIVEAADDRRRLVQAHQRRLRTRLQKLGFDVPEGETPIVPVLLGAPERAVHASAFLEARGFLVRPIRPPTVPVGTSRLRVVPTARHRTDDIDALLEAFEALSRHSSFSLPSPSPGL